MITRNHPTDKPEARHTFTVLLVSGESVSLIAHYATSAEEACGRGYAFWDCRESGPVCLALFARDCIAAIITR